MRYYIEVWVDGAKRQELSYICDSLAEKDKYFIYTYFWLRKIEVRVYTFEDLHRPETVELYSKNL